MTYIVTHAAPDWDALCAVWLLKRYGGFAGAHIQFVNTGAPDESVLANADAVVDTGGVLEPDRWRFDHHQFPESHPYPTCAAMQVFSHLLSLQPNLMYLAPLVNLVEEGDIGVTEGDMRVSRSTGIHAILNGWHADTRYNDMTLWIQARMILDGIAGNLKDRHDAIQDYSNHQVWHNDDGSIVALDGASRAASTVAFERNTWLVVFHNVIDTPDGPTHAVGVQRNPRHNVPHVSKLVEAAIPLAREIGAVATARELESWYLHPAGFYAGRGTPKAPRRDPVEVGLAQIAKVINDAWEIAAVSQIANAVNDGREKVE